MVKEEAAPVRLPPRRVSAEPTPTPAPAPPPAPPPPPPPPAPVIVKPDAPCLAGLASICGRLGVLSATGTGPPPPASQTASQEEVLAFLTALVGDVEVSAEGILMTKPLEALVERLERRVGIGSAEVKADKMDREALLGMFEGMVGRLEKCA